MHRVNKVILEGIKFILMKIQKTKMVENWRINDRAKKHDSFQARFLAYHQGLNINDNQNLLKSVDQRIKGPEDFHIQKEFTPFDHERIPEQSAKKMVSGEFWIFRIE